MKRALDSAIGLPSSSTSTLWMLVFLMPDDVSSNRMMSLLVNYNRGRRSVLLVKVLQIGEESDPSTRSDEILRKRMQSLRFGSRETAISEHRHTGRGGSSIRTD